MNSKMLLLSIAVVSVGLFAMPSTLSLFAGQHTFYQGASVPCNKCHQSIYDEMALSSSTTHNDANLRACQGCHIATNTSWYSISIPYNGTMNLSQAGINFTQNPNANYNAHAAVTLECVTCHQGVGRELVGISEAHTQFYLNSSYNNPSSAYVYGNGTPTVYADPYLNNGLNNGPFNQTTVALKGANTACVGCHTHIWVNITWTFPAGYNLKADGSGGGNPALGYKYNLTFTSLNGTSTTYSAGQ